MLKNIWEVIELKKNKMTLHRVGSYKADIKEFMIKNKEYLKDMQLFDFVRIKLKKSSDIELLQKITKIDKSKGTKHKIKCYIDDELYKIRKKIQYEFGITEKQSIKIFNETIKETYH